MFNRLVIDKKNLYLSLSLIMLISSIISFNVFNYKYSNSATTIKEKTEDGSLMILTSIGKDMEYDKYFNVEHETYEDSGCINFFGDGPKPVYDEYLKLCIIILIFYSSTISSISIDKIIIYKL